MNAVIALCHFCESHGPRAIFCTQTLRDTKVNELEQQPVSNKLCTACNSLGEANGFYSKDTETGATFLSTQVAVLPEVAGLLRQAAVRSLSCEISNHKDGGFVFFGDANGHVLSHTFQVADVQARGFYQLFSFIILMKDKYFLLNIKPFLAENLNRISEEIQDFAQKVKETEEAKGGVRQRRGSQIILQTPRSLNDLTGEENIYAYLHSHLSWLLLAGSRYLTEHVTFGNLPWLPPQGSGGPIRERLTYTAASLAMIQKLEEALEDPEQEQYYSLRHIKKLLNAQFTAILFCALTGIKIIVRGSNERTFEFMLSLRKLLPDQMHHLMRIDAQHQHSISGEYKIISLTNEIAVPIASGQIFRIDFLDAHIDGGNGVTAKWPGEVPSKCPDLLVKLVKAVEDARFTDIVLNKQTRVLIEEWKNKVICLNRTKSLSGQSKLKKTLGVQLQDEPLINYWSPYLS